ncbi:SGNH/GDSL hydrolase family protein [Halobacillus kuroshimensis]|uniref:SGNH/GDSL hydrolase family protein n=1 Tax=Halobacillus kuroshimensis TaxID=302481 RepID=A0ABS3DXT7_9BACI|nr:SGNH/GDSL hydrolase family protein [Halobacillus kuroshimensis]
MKKWRWTASILLTLILAFFITASFIYTPEEQESSSTPEEQSLETGNADVEEQPETEQEEVSAEEDENALGEGLRDVFTSVMDSARDLFIKNDLTVVAIGDSLTQGVGDGTDNGGYVGILEDNFTNTNTNTSLEVINYGKRGNRTDQMLERMEDEDISRSIEQADIVLITIGANDVMKVVKDNFTNLNYQDFRDERDGYEERLKEIIEKTQNLNDEAPIYFVGLYNPFNQYFDNIPELGEIMGDWNEASERIIDTYDQAHFIPIRDIFDGNEEELLWEEDHFHPNEQGYKEMAERVLAHIREDIEE